MEKQQEIQNLKDLLSILREAPACDNESLEEYESTRRKLKKLTGSYV